MDTLRAIDVLKSRPEVDPQRIGVYGSSQGGALAIVLPALRPQDVVVAAAGVPYLTDYLGAAELTRTYPFHEINDYLHLYPQRRGAVKDALAYFDCLNFAPQVTCPIVVSLGTQDNIVPPETCRAAFDALGSAEKSLYVYGHCGHDGGMSLGFTDRVRDFLAEHLRPSTGSSIRRLQFFEKPSISPAAIHRLTWLGSDGSEDVPLRMRDRVCTQYAAQRRENPNRQLAVAIRRFASTTSCRFGFTAAAPPRLRQTLSRTQSCAGNKTLRPLSCSDAPGDLGMDGDLHIPEGCQPLAGG